MAVIFTQRSLYNYATHALSLTKWVRLIKAQGLVGARYRSRYESDAQHTYVVYEVLA